MNKHLRQESALVDWKSKDVLFEGEFQSAVEAQEVPWITKFIAIRGQGKTRCSHRHGW